jgi:hypothetical protein
MADAWEKPQQNFFALWDIDREFQNAYEAYEQWQARSHRKRSAWACLGVKHHDDALGKTLSLGRQVQRVMDAGMERFGSRFEQGDSESARVFWHKTMILTIDSNMSDHSVSTAPANTVRNQTASLRLCISLNTNITTVRRPNYDSQKRPADLFVRTARPNGTFRITRIRAHASTTPVQSGVLPFR